MAEAIVSSQEEENTQVITWKQDWCELSYTPLQCPRCQFWKKCKKMGGMEYTMAIQADVHALQNIPEAYTRANKAAMVVPNLSAVDAKQLGVSSGAHKVMRELDQIVIDEQQREIDQLREWRATWYPNAPAE